MMGFDWSGDNLIRINVVSWPISEQIGAARERAQWKITTLDNISASELEASLAVYSVVPSASDMEVSVNVLAADELLMSCEYDSSIPEPMRLGGVSRTWRFLDEELARLWMIGDWPRSHFPEFMRQRRAQLDSLSPTQRLYLMFASIARIEPLIAAAGEMPGSSHLLVGLLAKGVHGQAALEALSHLTSRLAASFSERKIRRTPGDPGKADLGALLIGLSDFVARALNSQSTNDIARCIEEVFDIFHLFDRHYNETSSMLARREDCDYRDDLNSLSVNNAGVLEAVMARAISSADLIREVVAGTDVRRQLVNANM